MANKSVKGAGEGMSNGDLNWVANFIWNIADDVLRDLYVRGKYRDVILPMTVLRRLDAVLEPTKKAVLDAKSHLDKAKITNQDAALRAASGHGFYNTSKFTLRDLRNRGSQQQLKADFEAYLDGFSRFTKAARPIRCAAYSRQRSRVNDASWNTSQTAICAIVNRCGCKRPVA
jgi:type I restriction-modification system DNA methylase subunit